MLEKYFDIEKLKDGVIECVDASGFEVNDEIFTTLGELNKSTWKRLTYWASEYFSIASVSLDFSHLI